MPHYFSEQQNTPVRESTVTAHLLGYDFVFTTVSGTFSIKQLDKGTEVLIKNAIIKPEWSVLDLGCGWGPVGVACAKVGCTVTMVDINFRAVKYAKKNCEQNKVKAKVYQSDGYAKVDDTFDTILLNPPQTAGKDVCFRLITEAFEYLNDNGLLQIVARHQKGGKHLSQKMREVFGNMQEVGKGSGFRVYVAKKTQLPSKDN